VSENRWAVLVGACGYSGYPELRFAADDAVAFATAIAQDLDFDRKRMLLVVDDADDIRGDFQPTRNSVFHALGLLGDGHSEFYTDSGFEPMGEDDLFLFYFSGHGLRTSDGDELLLLTDSSRYSVSETAVRLESVVDCIEKLPCRHKVLFLDACREQMYDDAGAKAASDGAKGVGTPTVVEREGLATFYSCDPGQRSYEIEELEHGSFTYHLLRAIQHPDINTLGELDNYLKSRVPQENLSHGKTPQQPFLVPRPVDMTDLALFRVAVRAATGEDFVAMTNELQSAGSITFELWEKLSTVWESPDVANFNLKKAIFREFYSGRIRLDDFQAKWQLSERVVGGASPSPTISPTATRS
jgi:hypothetical protein